jgi:hypothetical protein
MLLPTGMESLADKVCLFRQAKRFEVVEIAAVRKKTAEAK